MIDREKVASLLYRYGAFTLERCRQLADEITALASQKGAQAGEVKQWRHKITRSEWSGWYDGEPVEYLSKFGHVQRRTLYTTPPAPDEAVEAFRNADEEDWKRLFAMIDDSGHGRFWKAVFNDFRRARSRRDVGGGV